MAKKFLGQVAAKAILEKSKAWADKALADAKTYADSSVGGVEIPSKVSQLTNDSGFQTAAQVTSAADSAKSGAVADAKSYTDTKLAELVGGAPETLDTLKEIADILDNSADTNLGLIQQMGQKANKSDVDESLAQRATKVELEAQRQDLQSKITALNNDLGPVVLAVEDKADKATTLAGYGITDAKIAGGVITLGAQTITPLTAHQDISGKADKSTTLAGYGIGNAYTKTEVDTALDAKINESDLTEFTAAEIEAIAAEVLAGN